MDPMVRKRFLLFGFVVSFGHFNPWLSVFLKHTDPIPPSVW